MSLDQKTKARLQRYYDSEKGRQTRNRLRRERLQRLWDQVLAHYGAVCNCCGEAEVAFLTLDHIGDALERHKRPNGQRMERQQVLSRVIAEGYPDDLQILCWNCNGAKGCPRLLPTSGVDYIDRHYYEEVTDGAE